MRLPRPGLRFQPGNRDEPLDRTLPLSNGMTPEIALGRWLAFCAHPSAAWRILPPLGRGLLAATYAAASFVVSLAALLSL
jgi:hypothetical protein